MEIMNNKVVVYAYVCGDILHKGHLLALKNASVLGDFLIVGVLTDKAVMEKKEKPIISFDERIEIIQSLKYVDIAVPQNEYAPWRNVENIRPDILAESESHSEEILNRSRECMNKMGGRIFIMPYYPSQSSTEIKNKIIDKRIKNEQ
jgi:cytidyltransferase-like protein